MASQDTHHERVANLDSHQSIMAFYRQWIGEDGPLRVLDLGAGAGKVCRDLAAMANVREIVAFDRSARAMRSLDETDKIRKVSTGSHKSLPFEARTFHVVICRYAFHHFEERFVALKEVHRVLKDDGLLLLSDPILPTHSRDALAAIYQVRESTFCGYLTYHEMIRVLETGGFSPLMVRPYHNRYPNLHRYLKAVDDEEVGDAGDTRDAIVRELKARIAQAWARIDEITKEELSVQGQGTELSFQYDVIDLAARKGPPVVGIL